MRAPAIAAAPAAQARPKVAAPRAMTTLTLRGPYFHIGFYLRGNPGFDGRGLHLRIVVRRGLLRGLGLGDLVDTTSDHFVHRPLATVLWGELPGLECPLN